jgi:hypothetical protein
MARCSARHTRSGRRGSISSLPSSPRLVAGIHLKEPAKIWTVRDGFPPPCLRVKALLRVDAGMTERELGKTEK